MLQQPVSRCDLLHISSHLGRAALEVEHLRLRLDQLLRAHELLGKAEPLPHTFQQVRESRVLLPILSFRIQQFLDRFLLQ